uniref:Uncharacterized protein n=1 Tax=Eutreptiella gymnastica TaxID=73025 RepID=A0A7S1NDP9_9EUGL|mmetsp:Transcript_20092/g.35887  ORF Transcript_20092/g.35887 Transcript_20092/m.35887 type:complete len:102 (+) Transcript_20092:47-352(+)
MCVAATHVHMCNFATIDYYRPTANQRPVLILEEQATRCMGASPPTLPGRDCRMSALNEGQDPGWGQSCEQSMDPSVASVTFGHQTQWKQRSEAAWSDDDTF